MTPGKYWKWVSPRSYLPTALSLILTVGILGNAVHADERTVDSSGVPPDSIAISLPANGDPTGKRKALADRGVTYSLMYTNDLLSNVAGGLKRGTIDQGKVEGTLSIDFGKSGGIPGLTFFTNVFQIHNTGRIRRDYVGGINTIAAIEAVPATRLSELWLERKSWEGTASIRIGQLAADTEFFFSGLSATLLQSDWPTIAAANLPSGGPAYPLSTPGVRLKYETSSFAFLGAIFNGDPAGPGDGDEQLRNRNGLNFRVRDPALVMTEVQFKRNQEKTDTGLASTLKLGFWGHFGKFDDKRYSDDGASLADPGGSGVAQIHRRNGGIYAVLDQQLWRPAGGEADSGISAYGRISTSPSDRNLIGFYFDTGLVAAGLLPGRPNDKLALGFVYSRFSEQSRGFDRDLVSLAGETGPIRDFEANLEISYAAQIVPGWIVQPVVTHVWHPSGDASRDATVSGVRTFMRY